MSANFPHGGAFISVSIEKFQVNPDLPATVALKKIDETGERVLFVIDNEKRLMGTLTDGDIRRWILSNGSLNAPIEKIYNKEPIYLEKGYDTKFARDLMIKLKIDWVPVIDGDRRILEILFWKTVFSGETREKKSKLNVPVVIMAGGKGSRLDPLTRILPKALIPIGEKPVIEVIMDKFEKVGCADFYLVVNYKSGMIKSYFDNISCPYQINYVFEEQPLGTVGGLKLLPKINSNVFFLINCDTIINTSYEEIYDFHKNGDYQITLIGCARNHIIPYGVLEVKNGGALGAIIEKPEYHFMVNAGFYLVEKSVLELISDGEMCGINELINRVMKNGGHVGVYPVSEKAWIDVGQWEEYRNALKQSDL